MTDKSGFNKPKKSTLWLRAEPTGGGDPPSKLRTGDEYLTLEVIDFALSGARKWASRFHPIIVSDLSVSSLQTRVRANQLIDPRQIAEGISSTNADLKGAGVRTLCAQLPWNDTFKGEINVLALRSEKLLKTVLGTYTRMQGTLQDAFGGEKEAGASEDAEAGQEAADDGFESVTAVIVTKVAGAVLKKVGAAAAVEATKIITAEDGTYKTRLSKSLSPADISPGYYVLIQGGGRAPAKVTIDLAQSPPLVLADGKPLKGKDFAVVHARASARHEDISAVPRVGDAWATLRSVVSSGGDPRAAHAAFIGAVTFSPELIESDKQEMQKMVKDLLAPLTGDGRAPGFETSLVSTLPHIRRAMASLAKAWADGKFAQPTGAGSDRPGPAAGTGNSTGTSTGNSTGNSTGAAPVPVTPPGVQPPPSTTAQRAETENQRFEAALTFCFRWEGDYSDDPVDRGGATKYGITEKVYHAWLEAQGDPPQPVKQITKEDARQIYWANYWRAVRCDSFKRQLDLLMFDACVNHGTGGAVKILQRTLNALRAERGDGTGEELTPDGAIGPRTIAEAARYSDTRAVCRAYLAQRRAAYERIIANDRTQERFRKGWMNRVRDLEQAIGEGGANNDFESVGTIQFENTPFAGYVD